MARKTKTNSTDEIEITPEMIKAGVRAVAGYNPEFELDEDFVMRLYRAMVTAMHNKGVSADLPYDWRVPDLEAVRQFAERRGDNVLLARLRLLMA
jgi:hypothetical protein